MKKAVSILLAVCLAIVFPVTFYADGDGGFLDFTDTEDVDASVFFDFAESADAAGEPQISAPSAILMEKSTGTVIYEKDADNKMEPASVTKVMTILLIVEAIENGTLSLDEMVTCSTRASSMGGSQIYLKENEQLSVQEMLKSIVVASANDAAVAMAEHMCGTEDVFVTKMNERAAQLGMTNTNFTNCTGLMDDETHVTTARDIAIMSRELISHDMIKDYTTIWMDTVRNGEFGLTNTNKLVRYYEGATGLKTGFTNRSMYCLSATAERDGMELIAVIMHGETSAQRFEDAKSLLNYGFANYTVVDTSPDSPLPPVMVELGTSSTVQPIAAEHENMLIPKSGAADIKKTVELPEKVGAPLNAGDKLGTVTIYSGEEVIYTYDLVAGDGVERLSFPDILIKFSQLLFGRSL